MENVKELILTFFQLKKSLRFNRWDNNFVQIGEGMGSNNREKKSGIYNNYTEIVFYYKDKNENFF